MVSFVANPQAGFFLCAILAIPILAGASPDNRFTQERKHFLRAENALAVGDMGSFKRYFRRLGHYPLVDYLEYAELKRRLSKAGTKEVEAFLSRHGDTPISAQLRRRWLKLLAKRAKWATFLQFYDRKSTFGTTVECRRAHALAATERSIPDALAERLWLVGKSQPRACDPVFKSLADSGWLTPDRVWSRIELAMRRGQSKLATYLSRYLPQADRRWVARWVRIRRHPEGITKGEVLHTEHPMRKTILIYGLGRLARTAPEKAESAWQVITKRIQFTVAETTAAARAMALAYAAQEHPRAEPRLAAVDKDGSDVRIRETRIVHALKRRDWALVVHLTQPFLHGDSSRWRYWHARGLYESGREQAGEQLMMELAGQRSYYGFLAADRTGLPYNLSSNPVSVDTATLDLVRANAGVQRASELFHLGRLVAARREWHWATARLPKKQLAAAAKMADAWRWHHQAIFTIARARCYDDLEMRFPLVFHKQVDALAKKSRLEPAWVFAVMRQESAFNSDARSRAGAMGLMQIMPSTGRQIAKSLNFTYRKKRELLDVNTNMRFGTHYLQFLLRRLNQHRTLATAAYNAGPHRVKTWLPREKAMPGELWVETVPFRETRRYLTRILAYTAIYENRMGGEPTPLSEILGTVPSRTTRAAESASSTSPT